MRRRGSHLIAARRMFALFRRARRGAVALEFGIMAIVYFTFMLGTMEMLFVFYAQNVLDLAVHTVVRKIQIGAAQGLNQSQLASTYFCSALTGLSCSQVAVKVVPVTTDYYTSTGTGGTLPVTNGTLTTGSFTVCPGSSGQFMYMQAIYSVPSFVGSLIPTWSVRDAGGNRVHLVMAGAGWANESFTVTAAAPAGC